MNKMLVAVFDTEIAAFEGLTALRELHKSGDITLYGTATLLKDSGGKITVKQADEDEPVGAAVGLLSGGMIGLLAGPVGLPIGAALGGLTGLLFDLDRSGINVAFVDDVSKALIPGKAAVVADVDESWTTPVNTRLHKLGAVVFRRLRSEVVEDQLNREAAAFQAELKALDDELRQASAEDKVAIQKDIDAVKKQLKVLQDQAQARLDEAKADMEAKLTALQAQAKDASDRTKARITKRTAEAKADFAVRSKKLSQAWDLTKQALAA
jgi:uncharacterized membrane protein